jgi:hypothetical protein
MKAKSFFKQKLAQVRGVTAVPPMHPVTPVHQKGYQEMITSSAEALKQAHQLADSMGTIIVAVQQMVWVLQHVIEAARAAKADPAKETPVTPTSPTTTPPTTEEQSTKGQP